MELHLDVPACPAGQDSLGNLDDHQAVAGMSGAVDVDRCSRRLRAGKPQCHTPQHRPGLYPVFPEHAALCAAAVFLFRAWPVHPDLHKQNWRIL